MQDLQTLKSEIISALDFLSSDSLKLLAKFVAFLRTNASQPEVDQLNKDMIETVDDDNLTLNFPPSGSPQAILQLTGTLSVEEGEAILEVVQDCRRIDWELWD
jgi:hypothetical protein